MANIKYNDIQDINESWENYAGSSVEKFIKQQLNNKAGYIYRSQNKEGDYYYLYGFTDYDAFEKWAGGDPSVTPLFRVQLPNAENDTYAVNLTTNSNTTKIVNLGDGVVVGLKYTSVSVNPTTGVTADTYNDGTLIIQRSSNGSAFVEVGRVTIQPTPYSENTFKNFNLTPYLVDGDNKIRMRVEDNVNGSISTTLTFQSVVNTTLSIENNTSTETPLRALQFQYYIQGQVAKTLHLRISQGSVSESFSYVIGENTYIEVPYTTPLIEMDIQNGIIEVESWLSVDGTDVNSYIDSRQFYYSDGTDTNTVIILNNVNETVVNYTNQHLFDMTIYNQGTDVTVNIQSMDGQTVYQTLTYNDCNTSTVYSIYTTLEIESVADSFSLMVVVNSPTFNCTPYSISVDNREKMAPVEGASFVLNPKLRNNTEAAPNTIINTVTGNTVSSTFSGFGFINDGWLPDSNNIGVLRIPSKHSLTVNYDVFTNLVNGTSIEIDFKTYNIFDDADEVIKLYTTSDNNKLGFVANSTQAAFYTSENQVERDQDVIFQEGERTHLVINIVPNLANSGLNYVRMFINGVLNREMLYSNTDVFKNGTCRMVFGSQHCDLDIYGIRVYHSGLSAADIRQNYMASLPDMDTKLAFKRANDILSANGTISYEKARIKYNTLIWTGNIPSYSTGNREYQGKLQINILGDAAHSGTITGLRCKGQGSSSRGYWKWNQQYDWNKIDGVTTVWTDGNGTEHRDGYTLTDNDPAATKLVAKLNWASSMQSHKMGSTALYTDLWRTVVGGNSITKTAGYENARVTVNELPFLFFVKETDNAQPVYYGQMTFGSAKYDKATFGYNKNVFPEYLILEGSDNGMPLTLRQVPWFDDEVTYNTEEEYYEYAGQGNWDYGMGKQENVFLFRDATNFTYLHSPFLVAFTGSISEDADKKYQYWDTATRNVFRYDYINQEWVNAGTTKTNGEYDVLNLETQTSLLRSSYSSDAEYTTAVIAWRKADFKSRISTYYNTTDVLFSMALLKLIGASDNWCKNTYEYVDPVTFKLCLAQDDMDTLMLTDNVGRKTKPYYVEEHDLDGSGKPYFNGSDNVFFNLMEMAFESEEKAMMKQILNTMANDHNSVAECIDHYFFSIQKYFPAVVYNETARLLYEEASVKQSQGIYVNGTPAISQSLGDQLQGEMQWWKRRIPYMQSWSSTDPFYTRSTTEPNLQFRSMTTISGNNPEYSFALRPWQWLYPKTGTGQYLSYDATRVQAGNVYNTVTMTTDGNTDTFVYGCNYYTSYGEFGGVSLSETFNLVGDRLLEFSADSREVNAYNFRPSRMTVTCPSLRELCLYGCSTLSGVLNLSSSIRLETVDLRGTSITSAVLPETDTLTTLYLPAVTALSIVNVPNLYNFTITSYNNLVNITTDNSEIALDVILNATNLGVMNLQNIEIETDETNASDVYDVLVNPDIQSSITGHIYLDLELTQLQKIALETKYGSNVFVEGNAFYISYIVTPISSVTLTASKNSLGNSDILYIDASWTGNDDAGYNWNVSSNNNITLTKTKTRLTIESDSENIAEEITVTYTLNKTNGTSISNTINITLLPYTFYINNVEFNEFIQTMHYGSGDNSITYSDGWEITCDNENVEFEISNVSVEGGSATYNGTSIASITKTTLSNNTNYNCTVTLLVDEISISYVFTIKTILVLMSINNIADIQAINGTGSGNITFEYNSQYSSLLSVVSASVDAGGTNTISDLTINGCTLSVSGYSSDTSKTFTLTYKVRNGANCTVTKNFIVDYVEYSGKVTITYTINSIGETQILSTNSNCDISKIGRMKVENEYVTPSKTYNFTTTGTKTVEIEATGGYDLRYMLQSVTTVNTVTFNNTPTLGQYVCSGCTNLTNVTLVGTVDNIGGYAFGDCSNLNNIDALLLTKCPTLSNGNVFTYIKTNGTLLYPDTINFSSWLQTSQGYLGYYDWNTSIIKSNGIWYKIRETGVVSGNKKYAYITKPQNGETYSGNLTVTNALYLNNAAVYIKGIENNAFRNCSGLISINMNSSVLESIGTNAFLGCTGLTTVNLGQYVNNIGDSVFLNCSNLSAITVNSLNSTYNDGNGSNCVIKNNSLIIGCKSTVIPDTVTSIGSNAFNGNTALTSITIPSSVKTINANAFYGCSGLTSLTIPSTVTSFGQQAFRYCRGLTSIEYSTTANNPFGSNSNIFSNCTSLLTVTIQINGKIPGQTFTDCTSLKTVNLTCNSIDNGAFSGCNSLETLELHNVTYMSSTVFNGCVKLSSIVLMPSNAPTIDVTTWGRNNNTAGYSSGTTNILYVPQDATGYDTTNWTNYLLNPSYGKFTLSKTL